MEEPFKYRKEKFLEQSLQKRVERLADNMRGINQFVDNMRHYEIVRCIFEETELFLV